MPGPNSTLQAIQQKVRRLTKSPSPQQITDDDLNNYINTFLVYDFPEHLRTFNFRTEFNFWCNAFQDTYYTDEISYGGATQNPLYNFQNQYLTVHPPYYVAGYQAFSSQSREQFYGIYPLVNSIASIGVAGDGATTSFSGVINSQQAFVPAGMTQQVVLLQNNVLFSSVDANNAGLAMIDFPLTNPTTGFLQPFGNLYVPGTQPTTPIFGTVANLDPNNNINYVTGAYTVTFPTAPGVGVAINSQTIPQITALPQAVLFHNNTFVLRPVPDQPYQINFEVYVRPTALLATNQSPQLEEYWQLIALGASRKILQDRLDMDTVQLIEPEYRKQMNLVNRRTIVQYTNERAASIYTEQVGNQGSNYGWGWPGSNF